LLGLKVLPSVGNFVLVGFPEETGKDAVAAEEHLKKDGIIPRGVAGYGLPTYIRITIGLEEEMRRHVPEVSIFGDEADRLPNTTCAAVPGIAADLLLMRLDLAGIAVSAGSACSAGKISSSPVLEAMGIDACLARGAIRISQGLYTENHHIDRFLAAWGDAVRRVLSHEVTAMVR